MIHNNNVKQISDFVSLFEAQYIDKPKTEILKNVVRKYRNLKERKFDRPKVKFDIEVLLSLCSKSVVLSLEDKEVSTGENSQDTSLNNHPLKDWSQLSRKQQLRRSADLWSKVESFGSENGLNTSEVLDFLQTRINKTQTGI